MGSTKKILKNYRVNGKNNLDPPKKKKKKRVMVSSATFENK